MRSKRYVRSTCRSNAVEGPGHRTGAETGLWLTRRMRQATCAGLWLWVVSGAAACGGAGASVPEPAYPDFGEPWPIAAQTVQWYLEASLFEGRNEPEQAIRLMRQAVESAPEEGELHLRLASMLASQGEVEETALHTGLAVELGLEPWRASELDARALVESGDEAAAAAVYAGASVAGAPTLWFERWFALGSDMEDPAVMAQAADAFVVAWPELAVSHRTRARALQVQGRVEESAAMFEQAATMVGGLPEDYLRAGLMLMEDGQPTMALASYESCTARFRHELPCWIGRTVALDVMRERGEADAARVSASVEELAARSGGDRYRFWTVRSVLEQTGRRSVLLEFARTIAAQRPFNATILASAAYAAVGGGDTDLALELMQRVLALDDANFDALNFIGYELAERGVRLDEAELYIREALFLRPDSAHIEDSLAWVLFRQGRVEEALVIQERVVELLPDNAVILDHMGDIYEAVGRYEDALVMWERAVRFAGPYDEDVATTTPAKLNRVRERLGGNVLRMDSERAADSASRAG